MRPLDGMRVIDVTRVLAGPYCTYQLHLLGAEVIKVEIPDGGDWSRGSGSDAALNAARMGTAFLAQNAGKRSITINLKDPRGQDVVRRLAADADVFVENLRPGAIDRLQLGAEALMAANPRLVYCSISAFGQDGPVGHRPAYDYVVQGFSGLMSLTGTPESGPLRAATPFVDYVTGMNAAYAVLAALYERAGTGHGRRIDVAMLDAAFTTMPALVTDTLVGGATPTPRGHEPSSGSPAGGAFPTACGGRIVVAPNNERYQQILLRAVGLGDLLADPRFKAPADRKRNENALREALRAVFITRPAAAWEALLDEAGVPAARLRTLPEAVAEEQVRVRGITAPVTFPDGRQMPAFTAGFKVDGATLAPAAAPPRLGADTDALLAALGFDAAAIARLRADAVV